MTVWSLLYYVELTVRQLVGDWLSVHIYLYRSSDKRIAVWDIQSDSIFRILSNFVRLVFLPRQRLAAMISNLVLKSVKSQLTLYHVTVTYSFDCFAFFCGSIYYSSVCWIRSNRVYFAIFGSVDLVAKVLRNTCQM